MAARKAKLSRATTGKNDAPPSLHKVVPTRGHSITTWTRRGR